MSIAKHWNLALGSLSVFLESFISAMMKFLMVALWVSMEMGISHDPIPVPIKSRTCLITHGLGVPAWLPVGSCEVLCWFRYFVISLVPLCLWRTLHRFGTYFTLLIFLTDWKRRCFWACICLGSENPQLDGFLIWQPDVPKTSLFQSILQWLKTSHANMYLISELCQLRFYGSVATP